MSQIKITSVGEIGALHVDDSNLSEAVGWPVVIDRPEGGHVAVTVTLPMATISAELEGTVELDGATVKALHALGWVKAGEQ